jgi:hypothetical protein
MLLHRKNDLLQREVENALRTSARIDDLVHTRRGPSSTTVRRN